MKIKLWSESLLCNLFYWCKCLVIPFITFAKSPPATRFSHIIGLEEKKRWKGIYSWPPLMFHALIYHFCHPKWNKKERSVIKVLPGSNRRQSHAVIIGESKSKRKGGKKWQIQFNSLFLVFLWWLSCPTLYNWIFFYFSLQSVFLCPIYCLLIKYYDERVERKRKPDLLSSSSLPTVNRKATRHSPPPPLFNPRRRNPQSGAVEI